MVGTKIIGMPARGLLSALQSALQGDDGLLEVWWRGGGIEEIRRVLAQYGLNRSEIEEGAQRVVCEVWFLVAAKRSVREETPWLSRLIRNVAVSTYRHRSTSVEVPSGDAASLIASSEKPHRSLEDADEMPRALHLLHSLPPPYRQIAEKQYLRGWDRRKITEFLE